MTAPGRETAALIERWKPRIGVPLGHVWHEHRGFRAGEIRNRAIRASRGDYCVFLDGDCLVRPRFRRHPSPAGRARLVRHRQSRAAVAGADRGGAAAGARDRAMGNWRAGSRQRFSGGLNRLAPVLRLPLGPLRKAAAHGLGGRALLQSRGLALRPRSRRWLRCELQRLGQGGFRSAGPAAARGRAAQGRDFRDRRAASVASRRRSLAFGAERATARAGDREPSACAPSAGFRVSTTTSR